MDVSAFENHLDLHGGDLTTWPGTLKPSVEALLATSSRAREALAAIVEVERLLRAPARAENTRGNDAVAAIAMRHRQTVPSRRLTVRGAWAASATLVLLVGIAIGSTSMPTHEDSPNRIVAAALSLSGGLDAN